MAGLTPLPPAVTHHTTRLTHGEAHSFLSIFLSRAEIDAAYRPDSTLAEGGPQALSTGSSPNLTLHHLKRILLGMEGKRMGKPVFEQDEEGAFDGERRSAKRARGYGADEDGHDGGGAWREQPYPNGSSGGGGVDIEIDAGYGDGPAIVAHQHHHSSSPNPHHANDEAEDEDEWQEKSTFDLAQSSAGLEPTSEDPQLGDSAAAEELEGLEDERTGEPVDKQERKRLKKLKAQAEKSKREELRKGQAKGF